jgi:hypothetical protein|tara:strand:- start:155 stop:316 length:162 start_codon:yes stop_codon:yes gene_type:complete
MVKEERRYKKRKILEDGNKTNEEGRIKKIIKMLVQCIDIEWNVERMKTYKIAS